MKNTSQPSVNWGKNMENTCTQNSWQLYKLLSFTLYQSRTLRKTWLVFKNDMKAQPDVGR
jgi:hypothetical protein